ncbi:MAG: NUDIX hydrolase [Ignavibacteriales bacterium]|nr:MAG: NUDIX hydrolase [Ignavibacteriales bacterium]
MNFKVEKSETLYKGKIFNLQVDQIVYNNGIEGIREIAVHPGGAVVIPLKDDGKIIMITQYRYPLNQVIIEFPAGKLDNNEDPLKCAVRELEEETGYVAEHIIKLGTICTAPGFCSELLHLYLASELTPGNLRREEGEEGIEVFEFSVKEIEDRIRSGEIYDAKSICAFYLAKNLLNQ